MKRLALFAVLTISIAAAISSCKKKACYQCTTTITVTIEGMDPTVNSTAKQDYCDITEDRAQEIEDAGSQTTVTKMGDLTVTSVTATTCQ